jgi:hypothetical protein
MLRWLLKRLTNRSPRPDSRRVLLDSSRARFFAFACSLLPLSAAALTPAQWREDLAVAEAAIAATHPDLCHSVDPAALQRRLAQLRQRLNRPMDRDQGWRELATVNPLLADAHFLIGFDDWRHDAKAHLAAGGGLFPFEVEVDVDGGIVIRSTLSGGATPLRGARIRRIDGMDARAFSRDLLARMHGDTAAFRAGLLSRRWPFYFWKRFGDRAHVDLDLETPAALHLRAPAAQVWEALDAADRFDAQFNLELLPDSVAVLRLGTFAWPDKNQLLAFSENAFRRIRDAGVRTLIIDVRDNGGGNDDQWIDGVLPYIADKPYRWASGYRKKIIARYRKEGETIGAVVEGAVESWIPPQLENPLRFSGTTTVLVGRSTYSSAVLFANVMQDFGFATLAGPAGLVRSRQSGGVQSVVLPHSGLILAVPRFILQRPVAAADGELLTPDLILQDDPLDSRAAIGELLRGSAAAP